MLVTQSLLLKVVGASVNHEASVRVQRRYIMLKFLQFVGIRSKQHQVTAKALSVVHHHKVCSYRPIYNIHPSWHDDTADEFHSMALRLDIHLVLVKFKFKMFTEPYRGLLEQLHYMLLPHAVDDKVIDKSRVVSFWFLIAEFTDSVKQPVVIE